jgi:hypothetical protein
MIKCSGILEDGTMMACPLRSKCTRYVNNSKDTSKTKMKTPGYYNTKANSFNCNFYLYSK